MHTPDLHTPDWHTSDLPELVSTRGAATILGQVGVDRETCRRVLKVGLAGAPTVVGRTHLYARAEVEELTRWPRVEAGDRRVAEACRRGTFVARLGPRRPVLPAAGRAQGRAEGWVGADVTAPMAEQLRAASGPWRISVLGCVVLAARVQQEGSVPFVATVGGFVVLAADLTGVRRPGGPAPGAGGAPPPARTRHQPAVLTLSPPGGWARDWTGHRVVTGRGGPWAMWPDGLWPGW